MSAPTPPREREELEQVVSDALRVWTMMIYSTRSRADVIADALIAAGYHRGGGEPTIEIEELADRIRDGIYADERQTSSEVSEAMAALRELEGLAAGYRKGGGEPVSPELGEFIAGLGVKINVCGGDATPEAWRALGAFAARLIRKSAAPAGEPSFEMVKAAWEASARLLEMRRVPLPIVRRMVRAALRAQEGAND